MINKFFLTIIVSVSLTSCGFSPIYTTSSKQVIISKSEIIGDKDLAFNLEQKLNFKKDEKNLNAYVFKAQIYDTAESSLIIFFSSNITLIFLIAKDLLKIFSSLSLLIALIIDLVFGSLFTTTIFLNAATGPILSLIILF